VKHVELTSEWLAKWSPKKREEATDRRCRGLVVRAGPSGAKTFYRWVDVKDAATGRARRKREKLGRWAINGGRGSLSLGDAREKFLAAQDVKRAEVDGTGAFTVADLAQAYRENVLAHREEASNAWSWGIMRLHILDAQPDPKRPPFGEWPARDVRPPDLRAVVNVAKVKDGRKTDAKGHARTVGGPAVARATLRELKAIFANAVGSGMLEMSPAAVMSAPALGLHGSRRHRWLDAAEVRALFAALDLTALLDGSAKPQRLSATVRLAIAFLLYTPVRSHSLIGARWEELDLDAARWLIPPARQKLHRDRRAAARAFTVPLAPTAVEILRKLRSLAGESPWVLASPVEPTQHLAEKVLARALARLFSTGRLALGSKVTIHDLRRSWRAWAGDLGVAFEVAEKSLAHTLPGVADVYARAEMVEQRHEAAALVGAALDRERLGTSATVIPLAAARVPA
jgi:integrase